MSRLSDRISILLRERRLAVADVARALAIERSQLTQIANGIRVPNEVLIRRLASFFGEDPREWVESSNADTPALPTPPQLPPPPIGFVRVCSASEVAPGAMRIVLDGRVVVANLDGRFVAFDNVCPHAGGSLGEGNLDGSVLECPWHAGRWDVCTGEALTRLATSDLTLYKTRRQGDDLELSLDPA